MCLEKLVKRNSIEKGSLSDLEQDIRKLQATYRKRRFAKILKILLIGFLWEKDFEKRIVELTEKIQNRISANFSEINKIVGEIEGSGTYLIYPAKANYVAMIEQAEAEITEFEKNHMLESEFTGNMKRKLNDTKMFVMNYNDEFVKKRKNEYQHFWSKGSISLDDEQQTAIVTDDKHNLVVAAAGSGKTEVLITRIAYLIKRKPDSVKPNRILAIAYQRKAREQIEQRLRNRYGIEDVWVRTFHKLGKDILESSGRIIERTDIVDDNKKFGFVKSFFEEELITNRDFYRLFIRYVKTVRDSDDEATKEEEREVVAHARERSYVSINGTRVNSKAEKEIMDCLLTHKINGKPVLVSYEPDVGGFRPDFYLPQFDIFIEHWGLRKDGQVPEWFSQSTDEYRNSMEKKKKWFAENNKLLIETFAYEYNSEEPEEFDELLKKRLLESLQRKFPDRSFEFSRLNYEEILKLVWDFQKTPIEDIQNFITIAKTYGLSPEQIEGKLGRGKWSSKQLAFGRLALEVFRAYQTQLKRFEKTDFEDMINEAAEALEKDSSLYADVYDHILIDEYQDMSAQRLKLLKKLLERNPNCKLFCVGDDWQSIMGFSGSNLNFFVSFGDYFANPAVTKICTNYRSVKSIVDAGADLIRNNGASQVQKPSLSHIEEIKPIAVYSSAEKWDEAYFEETVRDCLRRIAEYLEKGYAPDEILVLTRYMRTKIKGRIRFFQIVQEFLEASKSSSFKVAVDHAKEPNAVRLLTVHKCKGLEAKVVFILNVVKGEFGFPSEIEDPAIFEVAREDNGIKD
jgi:DNA helicase-4